MKPFWLCMAFLALATPLRAVSDFFQIKDIKFFPKPPDSGAGIWIKGNPRTKQPDEFVPCLEAQIGTAQTARTTGLTIRAYFFDAEGKLVRTEPRPAVARRATKKKDADKKDAYDVPVIINEGKSESVFFRFPGQLIGKKWSAVVVFGDRNEASAKKMPDGPLFTLSFPEKDMVLRPASKKIARQPIVNPLIEHVVHTRNPRHPQITLFLRFPKKVHDASEIKGVLAMCALAGSVGEIKRKLQEIRPDDFKGLLQFADSHDMAVLCWGARTIWRPDASYDELDRETNFELDRGFDQVADAWERGVRELQQEYGIPTNNYLLWGICASAQWAHRLVLRKPDYFLAAFIHIPSSFDKPTPDAAKVLWLLTSGELDGGYQHGVRWYRDCRNAGYPMIYKPIMNLGHAGSPIADNLGTKFFEYALTLRDQRNELDKNWAELKQKARDRPPAPWVKTFREPDYFGDYLNQEMFPAQKVEMIPAAFRVPLPNKVLADAWNK